MINLLNSGVQSRGYSVTHHFPVWTWPYFGGVNPPRIPQVLGATSQVTTKMLAEEGAKSVVLLSRRGVVGRWAYRELTG